MTHEIFTLGRDDAWRSIRGHNGQPCANFYIGDDFVFVNGALHWLGSSGMAQIKLCYFDVENEELGNLSLPCHVGGSQLGVLNDFLYLSDIRSLSHVNVWVMEDDIQTGAWTLKWVVKLPPLRVLSIPPAILDNIHDKSSYVKKTRLSYKRGGDDMTNVIRDALSKVLVHYYPVAGRLTTDSDGRLVVNCMDEGAVFVEAKAGSSRGVSAVIKG
ncbi:hypothetical protein Vadar_020658 [Vaccinium darrowii]|uniref:Uncharacterized protein n=1 Tax=Vaccinium darrowii TaxID=229202 RepID=A0ACB7XRX6_9ERIC|nr:hypothetical protein Vadar_020658 [Vaccinium darrowii]